MQNNTFSGGQTIEKVIDAPSADASDDHNRTTHIWFTAGEIGGGLELIFDFGVSYDITTLHFWNYDGEAYDVDEVNFTFYDSLGGSIGMETIMPPLGTASNNKATDIPLVSPLNTRSVTAFLTGDNRQVDFQNIGFSAFLSDPDIDPEVPLPPVAPIPLPAAGWMLLAAICGLGGMRRFR